MGLGAAQLAEERQAPPMCHRVLQASLARFSRLATCHSSSTAWKTGAGWWVSSLSPAPPSNRSLPPSSVWGEPEAGAPSVYSLTPSTDPQGPGRSPCIPEGPPPLLINLHILETTVFMAVPCGGHDPSQVVLMTGTHEQGHSIQCCLRTASSCENPERQLDSVPRAPQLSRCRNEAW